MEDYQESGQLLLEPAGPPHPFLDTAEEPISPATTAHASHTLSRPSIEQNSEIAIKLDKPKRG